MEYLILNQWGGQFIELAIAQRKHVVVQEILDYIPGFVSTDLEFKWINTALQQFEGFTMFKGQESPEMYALSDCDQEGRVKSHIVLVELALQVADYLVKCNGYVSERAAKQRNERSTAHQLKEIMQRIRAESDMMYLTWNDLNMLSGEHDNYLQRRALWHLDLMTKMGGASNFTRRAHLALAHGFFEPDVFAWFAHHMREDARKHKGLKLPSRALALPENEKMADIGEFEIRRCRHYFSFYGMKAFIIAANSDNLGVCFDFNHYKAKNLGLNPGVRIKLRGKVAQKGDEKYTKINYAKVSR